MKEYDFSDIDFSLPEIVGGLARAYAVLLRNAQCQQEAADADAGKVQQLVPPKTANEDLSQPRYVQQNMF
jgi:hypothetical protein